jgi:hypothetical protein
MMPPLHVHGLRYRLQLHHAHHLHPRLVRAADREQLLQKVHMMQQAVEDAELAIAVMQRKLADAERARAAAEHEVQLARTLADKMRSDLEQKVRLATEDGHLRVKLLEETVERLGKRGEAAADVARLSAEVR